MGQELLIVLLNQNHPQQECIVLLLLTLINVCHVALKLIVEMNTQMYLLVSKNHVDLVSVLPIPMKELVWNVTLNSIVVITTMLTEKIMVSINAKLPTKLNYVLKNLKKDTVLALMKEHLLNGATQTVSQPMH